MNDVDKNEEWRMKNEEWRMKNEEWKMKNEEWRMKNEKPVPPPITEATIMIGSLFF